MNRRQFIVELSGSMIISANAVICRIAKASDTLVSETSPQAIEIHYVADSSVITKEKFNYYVAGSKCESCNWFKQQGSSKLGYCSMYFPTELVNAKGWCIGWNAKK